MMDYLQRFDEYMRENDKSENTISGYLSDLRQLAAFLGKDAVDMTNEDIEAFKEHLKEKGLKVRLLPPLILA